mmetsp:Transcript_19749/g.54923  ORF Transcript_19749/g.54923 Transcript_19749/m.54923 type:complete len:336 (+) Transcript_19749:583-1590(+)
MIHQFQKTMHACSHAALEGQWAALLKVFWVCLGVLIDLLDHGGERSLRQLAHELLDLVVVILAELTLLVAGEELLPCVVAFLDEGVGVLLVHELLSQSKDIWWLAVWDLVGAEPLADGIEHAWHLLLDVVDVVEEWGPLVLTVDGDDLPVGFAFIDHAEHTKDLDWSDGTDWDDTGTNLADIQRIVVSAAAFGIRVDEGWVFPCLWQTSVVEEDVTLLELTKLSLLLVLLDWCEIFSCGNFHLFSGELWNLVDVVEVWRGLTTLWVDVGEVDIVPQGDDLALGGVLGMDSVIQGVLVPCVMQVDVLVGAEGVGAAEGLHLVALDRNKCLLHCVIE